MRAHLPSYALLLASSLLLAGCGGSGNKASSAGAKVFASAGCGGCHALAAAGSKGVVGPDLDLLKPDEQTVVRQVREGGNGMPSFRSKLTRRQIAAVATFVSTSAKTSNATIQAFQPDSKRVSDCRDVACYLQAYGNVAYRDEPQQALAELDRDSRTNPIVQADCHQIAHWIGHAGLARFHGNAAEALGAGGMTCGSGYYHGVIEEAFAGVPRSRVAAIARRLCSGAIQSKEFVLYQCIHGLGHGLMIYSRNDLPYALHVCDQLATAWDRTSCTGGVFMQNDLPNGGGMGLPTKWLKASDLIYPCDAVAPRHKLYCYLMVTARILPAVRYDWRRTAAWCRHSEPAWVRTCFQSFGRDASGTSHEQVPGTLRLCRLAGNMEGECLYGAARDFANNYARGTEAARLCDAAPARYRSYCFYGVGSILGTLNATAPARTAACRAATRLYLRACLRGAGVVA